MSTVSIDNRWYQADHAVIERMDEIDKERTYFKQLAAERAVSLSYAIERATTAERERDEASAELERVKQERNRFADYLATIGYKPRCTCTMDDNMHEPSCNLTEWTRIRFERTAPVDWRESEQETPFGQMLDGMGDEVEP